jgi:hypothetical protein
MRTGSLQLGAVLDRPSRLHGKRREAANGPMHQDLRCCAESLLPLPVTQAMRAAHEAMKMYHFTYHSKNYIFTKLNNEDVTDLFKSILHA